MSELTELQLIRQIGRGKFGTVFLMETAIKEQKAIKVARGIYDKYDKEFSIQSKLIHENIVHVFCETYTSHGMYTIIMEYVEFSLHKIIEHRLNYIQPFCEGEIKGYLRQILLGINFCHENNVMHCDISSQNILINKNGVLKIADFGYATKETGYKKERAVTLWYRAPELLLFDIENPTEKAVPFTPYLDIWAIGCVALEIIDLSPVLQGVNEFEMLRQINQLCGTPENPKKIGWDTPFCRSLPYIETNKIGLCFSYLTQEFIDSLEGILEIEWSLRPTAKTLLEREPIYSDKCKIPPFNQNQIAAKIYELEILCL